MCEIVSEVSPFHTNLHPPDSGGHFLAAHAHVHTPERKQHMLEIAVDVKWIEKLAKFGQYLATAIVQTHGCTYGGQLNIVWRANTRVWRGY